MVRSRLEDHPEYVQAIGMITIEATNLEWTLCAIIGTLLGLHASMAQAIYYTPRTQNVRLDILLRVAEHIYPADNPMLENIRHLVGRVNTVSKKRNKIVHGGWGVSEDGHVTRSLYPARPGKKREDKVKLQELTDLVEEIRTVGIEALNVFLVLPVRVGDLRPPSDPDAPLMHIQIGPDPPQSPSAHTPRKGTPPKRQRQPRS